MEHFGLEGYQFEPEYTEAEMVNLAAEKNATDTDSVGSETETDTSEEDYCLCGECEAMPSEKENVCCHSVFRQHELDFGACITEDPNFAAVCLQKLVLELAFQQFLQYIKKPPLAAQAQMNNRQKRLMAYRQISLWASRGQPLGKGNRRVLPSCCVMRIRAEFTDDTFSGYLEVQEALTMD
ncbi:P2X purinoceptor 7-like [Apostichopus japonicus]